MHLLRLCVICSSSFFSRTLPELVRGLDLALMFTADVRRLARFSPLTTDWTDVPETLVFRGNHFFFLLPLLAHSPDPSTGNYTINQQRSHVKNLPLENTLYNPLANHLRPGLDYGAKRVLPVLSGDPFCPVALIDSITWSCQGKPCYQPSKRATERAHRHTGYHLGREMRRYNESR